MYYQKQIRIGSIKTSRIEINDLLKAWLAVSIAFAIALSGLSLSVKFFSVMVISAFTVGLGFLLHELSHKFIAQRYGCFAEFRSFDQMLILAVIMSFFGFIFAAPGAVMINGPLGARRNGKISAAGPIVNLVLAVAFLLLALTMPLTGILKATAFYGFYINSWLALFNMIPVWNLDGAKILRWNKIAYGSIVAVALLLLFLQNFISIA